MKRRAAIAFTLALAAGAVASPAAAMYDPQVREAGLWYTERLHLDEIHARGLNGEGVTIAVIDGGINTRAAELRGADITVKGRWCVDQDTGARLPADSEDPAVSGHGTDVVSMIVGNGEAPDGGPGTRGVAPGADVWFYAIDLSEDRDARCIPDQPPESHTDLTLYTVPSSLSFDEPQLVNEYVWDDASMAALDAIRSGADIISVSAGFTGWTAWKAVMAEAIREGVVVVGAVPNPGVAEQLEAEQAGFVGSLPASLNGAVAVTAADDDAELITFDGERTTGGLNLAITAPGVDMLVPTSRAGWQPTLNSGTSYAAPIVASLLALGMENNPAASGHQVLQTLIRTPGEQDMDEPRLLDGHYGYGLVNPLGMLDVDATQFPDENPLFVTDPADPRCALPQHNPRTVTECTTWANSPTPMDVWPQEHPGGSGEEPPESEASVDAEQPHEQNDAAPSDASDGSGGVNLLLVGGAVAALALIVILGVVIGLLVTGRRRSGGTSHP